MQQWRSVDVMPALTEHICRRVDCPALKMPPDFFAKHEALAFAAMDALQPAQQLQAVISMCASSS